MGLEERPLILFKQLDKEGRKPMFMLRRHAQPVEGHTQGTGQSQGYAGTGSTGSSGFEGGGGGGGGGSAGLGSSSLRGGQSAIQLPGGVL